MLVAAQSKTFSPSEVGRLMSRACPGIDLFGTGGLR
jgi:hypothetical protein